MEKELIKTVPFDQFSRQSLVAKIIETCRENKQKLTLLDVGGYKGRTDDFFPHDKVITLDLYNVKKKNYIKGNAIEMPFEDKSFDFVMSFDVLEHIEEKDREKFLSECSRVAKIGIIIAAPHYTSLNSKSEQDLNNLYRSLHSKDHRWLKEHIDNGLPKFNKITNYLNKKNWETCIFPSNDTQLWVLMQGAIFINSKFPMSSERIVEMNEQYNVALKEGDGGLHPEEAYRFVLVAVKNAELKEKIGKTIQIKEIPFTVRQRIINRINAYYSELIGKTQQLANNYKDLYEHELKRATTLHTNNEKLILRIAELENEGKLFRKVNRRIRSIRNSRIKKQ